MPKVGAQRDGHWAGFPDQPHGLRCALILAAAVGFLYGPPGATWITGAVTREQNGRISAAGPATNIVIAAVFTVLFLVLEPRASAFGGAILVVYLLQVATVNAFLAGFNMLPIMPLDGAKVWAWNKGVYGALAVVAVGPIFLTFFPPDLSVRG